jgi:hypothetical protein
MTKRRAVLPWKMFFDRGVMDLGLTQGDEKRLLSATTLSGSTALPFVISTEAQRSGEISVWMLFLGNV